MSARAAGLRRHLYAFSFVDEIGPLVAIYPLWFADAGLSIAEISLVYVVWGSVELLSEVPSGALADVVDRRRLLAFALLVRAAGIVLWLVWPTFWSIVIGAALWAFHSALASGAWEALVYDELAAAEQADAYPKVMARIDQASHSATALSTLLAAALIGAGVGLHVLGWLSVAACLPAIALVVTLPRVEPEVDEENATWWRAWGHTLRQGARDARRDPQTFKLVLLGAVLAGLFIVDEYIHLLARARGASEFAIPLLVGAVWAGLLLGGELAARFPQLKPSTLGWCLGLGSALMALGLLLPTAWPLALVAVGYGALQTTWLLSDARFQESIPSSTRATVTSIRALGGGLISVAALTLIGFSALDDDPTIGLLVVVGVLIVCSFIVPRWVPSPGSPTER